MIKSVIALAGLLLVISTTEGMSEAVQSRIHPRTNYAERVNSRNYAPEHIRKLGRGVANILGTVEEIPMTMIRTTRIHGDYAGWTTGVFHGSQRAWRRLYNGTLDIAQFQKTSRHNLPNVRPEYPTNFNPL